MGEKHTNYTRAVAVYSTLLAALPVSTFGGYLLGSWLDAALETDPWLTVVFLLLGAVAGFHQMYRIITKLS